MADDLDLIKHFQSLLDTQSRMISENFTDIKQRFNKVDDKLDEVYDKLENHEIRLTKIEDHIESNKKPAFGFDNVLKYGQLILWVGFIIFYLGNSSGKNEANTIETSLAKSTALLNGNLPIPQAPRSSTYVSGVK